MTPSLPGTPLRIAMVAFSKNAHRFREDPSYIYRCENLAAALAQAGHHTSLLHLNNLPWQRQWDVLVLHRPRWCIRLLAQLAWHRQRGTLVVADFDDRIFDPSWASDSPGVLNGLRSASLTRKQFAAHRRALHLIDAITVSTAPLQEIAQQACPNLPILLLPNAAHHSWHQLIAPALSQPPRWTYCPGTRSHDRDFNLVKDQLEAALDACPDAQLMITGPLTFNLRSRPGQVEHQQRVGFDQYHQAIWSGSLNLAPLEDTPFNRCKSALKIIEAGWWGIPTLCTDWPDARRFEGCGAIIAPVDQWASTLIKHQASSAYGLQHSQAVQSYMKTEANVHTRALGWLDWVSALR